MAKKKKKKSGSKNAPKRTDLRSTLQSIYHDTVSLETTCGHTCTCCKVAMPQLNYSEFVQIVTTIWKEKSHADILDIICKSLEYFFRYDYAKWEKDALVKPCMLLDKNEMCTIYEDRPLSCRMYGLWPEDMYNERVDKFANAYKEKYGLERDELPLSKQCPLVKRKDDSNPLTREVIESLYKRLDNLDKTTGDFTSAQVRQKENYRTFHDWLLLKILGEEWLSQLTSFILAADKEIMEDQIKALKEVIRENFKNKIPDITKAL
jgi:Fe-S-cluster containining protein